MARILLKYLCMETNLLNICKIMAQQPGNQTSESGRLKGRNVNPDTQRPVERKEHHSRESDNANRSGKNDTEKFEETLQKKISPETSENKEVAKDKKENTSTPAGIEVMPQEVPAHKEVVAGKTSQKSEFGLSRLKLTTDSETNAKPDQTGPNSKANPIAVENFSERHLSSEPLTRQPSSVPLTKVPQQAMENGMQTRTVAHETIEQRNTTSVPDEKQAASGQQSQQQIPEAASLPTENTDQKKTPIADHTKGTRFENLNKMQSTPMQSQTAKETHPASSRSFSDLTKETTSRQSISETAVNQVNSEKSSGPLPAASDDKQTKTIEAQSTIHRVNLSAEQINRLHAEKSGQRIENQPIESEFKSDNDISQTSQPPSLTNQPPASASETPRPPMQPQSEIALDRQIHEGIRGSYRPGTQQIHIRLDPPELGRIMINFSENRDGITGVLHVDESHTKEQIQQLLPGMMQNLQNSDIQIKKLEVTLNQQQQFNTAADHSGQQDAAFEQHTPNSWNTPESSVSHNRQINTGNTHEIADSHIQINDDSINVLI